MLNGSCFNNGIPASGKDLRAHSSMSQSSSFSKSGQVAKWSLILGNMLSWHHMRLAPYSWCFRALQSFHDNHNLHIPTNSWKLMLDLYVFGGPNIAYIQAHVSIYVISININIYNIYLYIYIIYTLCVFSPFRRDSISRCSYHSSFPSSWRPMALLLYIKGQEGSWELSGLDVPLEVRIKGDRISGLFHPNISHL